MQFLFVASSDRSLHSSLNVGEDSVEKVFAASGAFVNCSSTTFNQYSDQCNYHGVCLVSGSCKCDDGYITWPKDGSVGCNYKQKSQLIAFLLSFLLGPISGAGLWYIGNIGPALAQLLLFGVCLVCATAARDGVGTCMIVLWVLAVKGLWLNVWIAILTGDITDGNGAPLAKM